MGNLETRLHTFESIPQGFLDTPVNAMHRVLPGPSLIHIAGKAHPPLFIATLLHGNEPTGIAAVQRLLKKYNDEGSGVAAQPPALCGKRAGGKGKSPAVFLAAGLQPHLAGRRHARARDGR